MGSSVASSLAASALFMAFAIFVLRPARGEWPGVFRVAAALGVGVPLLVGLGGLFVWRSLRLLSPPDSSAQDSAAQAALDGAALVRVHRAPLAMALTIFGLFVAASIMDSTGLVPWSGLQGTRGVAVGFAAAGTLQLGLHLSVIAWRDTIWSKLPRVPPQLLKRSLRQTLAYRLALRVISVAGFCAAWAVAAFLVSVDEISGAEQVAILVGLLGYGGVLLTWGAAYRLGRRVVLDVRRLTAFVRALRSDEEWTSTGELPVLGASLSTQPAEALNQAIISLAERFAHVANEEARVRSVMEQAERLRPRFMAYVSHDLRGPLNSIKGFAEILARGKDPLAPEQLESLATIQESGEELLRLVTEIIDTTRLEAGRIEIFPSYTPIVTLLTEAIGQVRLLRRRRPIALDTNLQPGLPALFVDRPRIVQALVSVLAFMQHPLEEGAVHVSVRIPAEHMGEAQSVCFEFRSSPAVDLGGAVHLFEALRPERAPTGQRVAGLGVGLALARGLVELHGGRLEYRLGLQRMGGVFLLTLPLEPREEDAQGEGV